MDTVAWSSSVHCNDNFELNDEFKIQLPLNLNDRHHIFFTLFATYQKKTPPSPGQPLGYKVAFAAYPLMVDGVVQFQESIQLKFVSTDRANKAGAGGYLDNFSKAPTKAFINNGEPVLFATGTAKTTIHSFSSMTTKVFRLCPRSIDALRRDDDVLAMSGELKRIPNPEQDVHRDVITTMANLPLAELMGFFPFFTNYALALIGSSSSDVAMSSRMHMLDALLLITTKVQQYDSNVGTIKRHHGVTDLSLVFTRTSIASLTYHFQTNDLLYEGERCAHKYRLYAGLAEVWLSLLEMPPPMAEVVTSSSAPSSPKSSASATPRNLMREMCDLSWFLLDTILRSLFLWAEEHPELTRETLVDVSFYRLIGNLCVRLLERLIVFDEGSIVKRVAIFIRGLLRVCDRGQVLIILDTVLQDYFVKHGNYDSLVGFLRYILEEPNLVYLLLPSECAQGPVFLTSILVQAFTTLLTSKVRETRSMSTSLLYTFVRRLSYDGTVSSDQLTCIASQMLSLFSNLGPHWEILVKTNDKIPVHIIQHEKRQLAVSIYWILFYTRRTQLCQWIASEKNPDALAGAMRLITDAQALFRYSAGDKSSAQDASRSPTFGKRDFDARNSTFITAVGTQLCHLFLQGIPQALRTVSQDQVSPCVYPFFVMLESILHLGNSTIALQMSAAALHEVVGTLFPEVVSRKAIMSSGLTLVTFRLMSSCCQHVRNSAGCSYLLMCQAMFKWKASLAKMKSLTANALVSVAESKVRDLRLAGRFIQFQFDDLIDRAKVEEANYISPSADFAQRYEDDSNAAGGDAHMNFTPMSNLFLSVTCQMPISPYLIQERQRQDGKEPPKFSVEFSAMSTTVLSLFNDVLRFQVDDSMRYKESRAFAYFEVFRNFLRQNALGEALKWLYRLHDAHRGNEDFAEAGFVLVFIAAMCFRVTEVFYHVKGENTKGARMPHSILSRVFWQDYVRLLPEVDTLLPADTVYAIVCELYMCPDDLGFTMEGQVNALKEAAELLDKGRYYEFSVGVMELVNRYLAAENNFESLATSHTVMANWCNGIATKTERENNVYFLLWVRMEREVSVKTRRDMMEDAIGEKPCGLPDGKSIRRIYKMPRTTQLSEFEDYAVGYIESLFDDEKSLVVLTQDFSKDTLPALPEPDTKRQRAAAAHRQPNHCLVSVCEVQPYFPKGTRVPPKGFDKTMHLLYFENVLQVSLTEGKVEAGKKFDVMSHSMTISKYELDRAFPSTTSAIDIAVTHRVSLNPYETAQEVLSGRIELLKQAPANKKLITALLDALTPMGTAPGEYAKGVIMCMSHPPQSIDVLPTVRELSDLVRKKLQVCDELQAMAESPEEYALVLKAITDIECRLIALQTPATADSSDE